MQDSMYSAMFGAMSNEIRMDNIANNLANVNTTGFKKDKVAFHDTFQRFAHDYLVDGRPYMRADELWPRADVIAKPRLSGQQIDFSQGNLQQTGNPLDLALSGEGFFRIRTGNGDYLTRNGSFQLSGDGRLVTEQGFEVLGSGGPVILPQGAPVTIDTQGVIRSGNDQVGQLDVVTVSDFKALEKLGNNLYGLKDTAGAQELPAEDVTVEQGYLEKGNVNVVTEMVEMIEVQRAFTLYTKMLQGTNEIDTKLVNQVGRTSG